MFVVKGLLTDISKKMKYPNLNKLGKLLFLQGVHCDQLEYLSQTESWLSSDCLGDINLGQKLAIKRYFENNDG